jgi:hypothetical protein
MTRVYTAQARNLSDKIERFDSIIMPWMIPTVEAEAIIRLHNYVPENIFNTPLFTHDLNAVLDEHAFSLA